MFFFSVIGAIKMRYDDDDDDDGWKEDSMLIKRIAACTHLPSTVSQ